MSGYTPNNFDNTQPTDIIFAETAQAEFRNIKGFFQGVMGRNPGPVDYTNTTAGVDIFTCIVPANSMGTSKRLRFNTYGIISYDVPVTISLFYVFGGVNYAIDTPALAAGSYAFSLSSDLIMQGASNAVGAIVERKIYATGSGSGAFETADPAGAYISPFTVDTTIGQEFRLSVEVNVADASSGIIFSAATLEWL